MAFCPPVKDISVAHFLLIHCSCSHASRLVIHIVDFTISETGGDGSSLAAWLADRLPNRISQNLLMFLVCHNVNTYEY